MAATSTTPTVLPPTNREPMIGGLAKFLATVFPGKPVRVKVEIARPDKTPAQNRFLWAVPYKMLSDFTGMESEEIHEWNCGLQWGWKVRKGPKTPMNPSGHYSEPIRTTTTDENGEPDNCSAEDMEKLWERAQRLGASLGIAIPDPDKDYKTKPRRKKRDPNEEVT